MKKVKRQPTEWEKIFANHIFKGLVSRTHKELLELKKDKFKIGKRLERFPQEDYKWPIST